ncbi:MAG: YMGG-like glycine zipper-containing protein [Acidobacteriota bacterium]
MIGATAVAGAATGALIGGKKGALIGAGAGGAGGYVLDRKTKRRPRR